MILPCHDICAIHTAKKVFCKRNSTIVKKSTKDACLSKIGYRIRINLVKYWMLI